MDKHTVKSSAGQWNGWPFASWVGGEISGEISVEVISRRRHCKQLCWVMEIPWQLEFNCSKKNCKWNTWKNYWWIRFAFRAWRFKKRTPLGATTSTESNDQLQVVIFTEGFQFNLWHFGPNYTRVLMVIFALWNCWTQYRIKQWVNFLPQPPQDVVCLFSQQ